MLLVGGYENDIARIDRAIALFGPCGAGATENQNLMLVVMAVMGRVSAGCDLELPHVEGPGAVLGANQHAHLRAHGTFHLDVVLLVRFEGLYFHQSSRWGKTHSLPAGAYSSNSSSLK